MCDELKTLLGEEPHKADLTSKLCTEGHNPQLLEYKFAVLTTLKSTYSNKEPFLALGTILKEVADPAQASSQRYWICIQPLCDSVRIKGKRAFPFLKLKRNENQFDLVLPESEDSYIKVRISYRPHESKLIEFAADSTCTVRAVSEGNRYFFTDKEKKKYEWVADLKFEHAQRILNKYATEQARVGLDESEWLRRSALKSGQDVPQE